MLGTFTFDMYIQFSEKQNFLAPTGALYAMLHSYRTSKYYSKSNNADTIYTSCKCMVTGSNKCFLKDVLILLDS